MKRFRIVALVLILWSVLCVPAALAAAGETAVFADPVLEQKIRGWLNRPTGDLYVSELENEGYLGLGCDDGRQITDLSGLEIFQGLDALELYGNAVTDLTPLAGLTYLRDVNLGGNQITDLSPLAGLKHLERLDLGGNRVTDLTPLAGKNLISLVLWENQITDITPLLDMNNLETLDLCNNRIADISALAGKTKLSYLALGGNEITDYSPVADFYDTIAGKDFDLDAATQLRLAGLDPDVVIAFADPVLESCIRRAMGIPDGDITAGDAAAVDNLFLMMDGGDWSTPRITDLSGIEYFINLTDLNLGWAMTAQDGNFDLSPLAGLVKLKGLAINNCSVTDLTPLAGLHELLELCVFSNNISDLSPLAGLTKLDTVWLNNNRITDISVLAGLPKLYRVFIAENMIADLSPLTGLANLKNLEISNNAVLDYAPVLGMLDTLESIDMDPEDMVVDLLAPENAEQVITFRDSLFENAVRMVLGEPEGDITAGDAAKIQRLEAFNEWQEVIPQEVQIKDITGIEYCINLRVLHLKFNAIRDISGLAGLTKLRELDLGGNPLQDGDISALAGLTNLEELTLFSNGISDLRPLQSLTNLRRLTLQYNGIDDLTPLMGLWQLEGLDLNGNRIADLTPLAGLTRLQSLYLAQNPIEDWSPIDALRPNLTDTDFGQADGQTDENLPLPDNAYDTITFPDPALEAAVRENLGNPEGDIIVKQVYYLEALDLKNDQEVPKEERIHDLTGLENFENLRYLDVSGQAVSDLTPLRRLKELTYLDLSGNQITDVSPLVELFQLSYLAMTDNQVSDITLFGGLKKLQFLKMEYNQIQDISSLAEHYELRELLLAGNPVADYTPVADVYDQLENRDFDPGWGGLEPENPDAVVVFNDPLLESLVRERMGILQGDITARDAAGIKDLDFSLPWQETIPKDIQVTDLTGIEYFINLETLGFNFHAIKDIGMLPSLTRLAKVDLGCNQISDLSVFADMPNLTRLVLFDNRITDISPLAGLTQLTYLQLEYNQITDLTALGGMTQLATLWLKGNPVEDYSPIQSIYPNLTDRDFEMP